MITAKQIVKETRVNIDEIIHTLTEARATIGQLENDQLFNFAQLETLTVSINVLTEHFKTEVKMCIEDQCNSAVAMARKERQCKP